MVLVDLHDQFGVNGHLLLGDLVDAGKVVVVAGEILVVGWGQGLTLVLRYYRSLGCQQLCVVSHAVRVLEQNLLGPLHQLLLEVRLVGFLLTAAGLLRGV